MLSKKDGLMCSNLKLFLTINQFEPLKILFSSAATNAEIWNFIFAFSSQNVSLLCSVFVLLAWEKKFNIKVFEKFFFTLSKKKVRKLHTIIPSFISLINNLLKFGNYIFALKIIVVSTKESYFLELFAIHFFLLLSFL